MFEAALPVRGRLHRAVELNAVTASVLAVAVVVAVAVAVAAGKLTVDGFEDCCGA